MKRLWRYSGWTLVELLIAMTLSLMLIAGIGQIYLSSKRNYDIQISLAQIQDTGRYVINVLSSDIHQAGYWGLMNMDAPPAINNDATPDGCPTGAGSGDWGRMITGRLFGLNESAAGYDCIHDKLAQSGDVLVVRYADPIPITTNRDLPPSSGAFGQYDPSRLYIRTAPLQGSIVRGNPVGDAHNLVTSPVFSDHAIVAHAYYVSRSYSMDCGGKTIKPPELARKSLDSNGLPRKESLVSGVERLQFQYGVDNDGNGSVDRYLNADQVADWSRARAVRFWVLARAICPEGGYSDTNTYKMGDSPPYTPKDGFRRALYTSTVALRN